MRGCSDPPPLHASLCSSPVWSQVGPAWPSVRFRSRWPRCSFAGLGDVVPWIAGALVLAPAVAYGFLPWGGFDGWAGALAWPGYVVVAVLVLVLGLSSGERPRLPRFFRRMPGSSTKR